NPVRLPKAHCTRCNMHSPWEFRAASRSHPALVSLPAGPAAVRSSHRVILVPVDPTPRSLVPRIPQRSLRRCLVPLDSAGLASTPPPHSDGRRFVPTGYATSVASPPSSSLMLRSPSAFPRPQLPSASFPRDRPSTV